MKFWKKIYLIYASFVFGVLFMLLFPIFIILVQKKSWHKYTHPINKIWAKAFFTFCFIPMQVEMRQKLDKKQQYIFCSNHFSYLDIVALGYTPKFVVFVGKGSLTKVPLFGYMFKKLHITVDRTSHKSRYETLSKSAQAIDEGKSLVIYPEGGIISKNMPEMAKFKDGAFRTAIEKQIPIVPVTLPYNWVIFPDDGSYLFSWHRNKVIFHEPIQTKDLSMDDLDSLKNTTFAVIDEELKKHNSV